MDPRQLNIDERFKGICVYCGGKPNTRDHVPSRVFLDEPYPKNLPVVESCSSCNHGFSASEQYLACLIECVINGITSPNENFRPKVARTLKARPAIADKIEAAKQVDANRNLVWVPEADRDDEVVIKLARGHIAYELGIHRIDAPQYVDIFPLPSSSDSQVERFLSLPSSHLYPEIGSRAYLDVTYGVKSAFEGWLTVQDRRYQYAVGQSDGDWVRIVINDYLACHVAWE